MNDLLERIGISLIAVRLIGQGVNEEMARDGADDEYSPVGEFQDVLLKVDSEEYMDLFVQFANGEFEEDSHYFTKGEATGNDTAQLPDPDEDDWENPNNNTGLVYSSQILASMTYGNGPYSKGLHDVNALLNGLGITDFQFREPKSIDYANYDALPNVKAERLLNEMFIEEANKRGVNPFAYEAISYGID